MPLLNRFTQLAGSYLAPFLLLSLPLISLYGLFSHWPEQEQWQYFSTSYLLSIISFSLKQALLSAILSISLAVLMARALARRQFKGKSLVLALLNASLTFPVIVVVLAVLVTYGKQGPWQQFFALEKNIYGLGAILLAHVFLNAPFAARVCYNALCSQSSGVLKQASQLGFDDWQCWRHLDWPLVKPLLAPLFGLVFLLCFNSFAIVLTLGGGPAATTLEVAIYQALRYEFDIPQATIFASIQLLIGLFAGTLLFRFRQLKLMSVNATPKLRPDHGLSSARVVDYLVLGFLTLFWILPMVKLFGSMDPSLFPKVILDWGYLEALSYSIFIALASALLCLIWLLGLLQLPLKNRFTFDLLPSMVLILPAIVLATGIFIVLIDYALNTWVIITLIILMNSIMALPYGYKILRQPVLQTKQRFHRQMSALGMSSWQRMRLIYWPLLAPAILLAFCFAFTLALGDLGMVVLFGTQDLTTLPLLVYRRLATHQLEMAAVTSLSLISISILVFWLHEKLSKQVDDV